MTTLSDNLPATKAAQDEANSTLADVLAKLPDDPASEAKMEQVRAAVAGLKTGAAADPVFGVQQGLAWADVSIAALSAGQAAGTSTVRGASATRKALMINPPADCLLKISTAAGSGGWPLFGGVPNTIIGQACPTNALYITGLATGQAVGIWEV